MAMCDAPDSLYLALQLNFTLHVILLILEETSNVDRIENMRLAQLCLHDHVALRWAAVSWPGNSYTRPDLHACMHTYIYTGQRCWLCTIHKSEGHGLKVALGRGYEGHAPRITLYRALNQWHTALG